MEQLRGELKANFTRFAAAWKQEQETAYMEIESHASRYLTSYLRLASLQAWRSQVLAGRISKGSQEFFVEAQNDALLSHVMARLGSWRPALQALRSCVENVLYCLYYMDHPVELSLWSVGKHRLGFSETVSYFERHPAFLDSKAPVNPLPALQVEFGILSKAVHGSAQSFRMTADGRVNQLWASGVEKIGAWTTREARCLQNINLVLLHLFREELLGARLRGTREAISLAVPSSMHAAIKSSLRISLFRS